MNEWRPRSELSGLSRWIWGAWHRRDDDELSPVWFDHITPDVVWPSRDYADPSEAMRLPDYWAECERPSWPREENLETTSRIDRYRAAQAARDDFAAAKTRYKRAVELLRLASPATGHSARYQAAQMVVLIARDELTAATTRYEKAVDEMLTLTTEDVQDLEASK